MSYWDLFIYCRINQLYFLCCWEISIFYGGIIIFMVLHMFSWYVFCSWCSVLYHMSWWDVLYFRLFKLHDVSRWDIRIFWVLVL
jgi:hypothetical protein